MYSLPYYIIFGLVWIFSLLPFCILYRISDFLFLITYYCVKYRKKTVLKNLRTSFPQKPELEIQQTARRFYRHFCDFLMEYAKGISISSRQIKKRMVIKDQMIFDALEKNNKNFALVSAHYNNWEWLNSMPLHISHKLKIIYRPLKNKSFDRLTKYIRERFGAMLIPMDNIYREALSSKAKNELFTVWFLADQRPPRNSKLWTNFLNHEAAFFEGVEKMSRKLDMAVVFMDIQKVRRGYYEVSFKKLFDSTSSAVENEITLACVREIEAEIINKPDYWLWSHKRFKHSRPENTKLIAT